MADFEYLNWLASQSKVVCDPTKNITLSGSALLDRKNDETFKSNNGQYPDILHHSK